MDFRPVATTHSLRLQSWEMTHSADVLSTALVFQAVLILLTMEGQAEDPPPPAGHFMSLSDRAGNFGDSPFLRLLVRDVKLPPALRAADVEPWPENPGGQDVVKAIAEGGRALGIINFTGQPEASEASAMLLEGDWKLASIEPLEAEHPDKLQSVVATGVIIRTGRELREDLLWITGPLPLGVQCFQADASPVLQHQLAQALLPPANQQPEGPKPQLDHPPSAARPPLSESASSSAQHGGGGKSATLMTDRGGESHVPHQLLRTGPPMISSRRLLSAPFPGRQQPVFHQPLLPGPAPGGDLVVQGGYKARGFLRDGGDFRSEQDAGEMVDEPAMMEGDEAGGGGGCADRF